MWSLFWNYLTAEGAEGAEKQKREINNFEIIHLRSSACICLYLRLKKENFATADDNGWTLMNADEKRDM